MTLTVVKKGLLMLSGKRHKKKLSLKRGKIHMKFSMTGQEKGDLLIQVTA